MHKVAVSKNGVDVGSVSFRGISVEVGEGAETRLYKCNPKQCVPKKIAKRIADRLAFGVTAGHEDDYEWHI